MICQKTKSTRQDDYKHSLTFRVRRYTYLQSYIRVCCHSNETHAPIANPSNSAHRGYPQPFPQVTSGIVQ